MGWLRWVHHHDTSQQPNINTRNKSPLATEAETIEEVGHLPVSNTTHNIDYQQYPAQQTTVADAQLPFISDSVIRSKVTEQDIIWIVVDNIVYDCSEYVFEHPGGRTVIESFTGQDCSWQFWRFHSKAIMHEHGRPLRIGRTEGVQNRFKERPRFVGLKRLWDE